MRRTWPLVMGTILVCTVTLMLTRQVRLAQVTYRPWDLLAMVGGLYPFAFAIARPHAARRLERWMSGASPQLTGVMLVLALFVTGFFASDSVWALLILASTCLIAVGLAAPARRSRLVFGISVGGAIALLMFIAFMVFLFVVFNGQFVG